MTNEERKRCGMITDETCPRIDAMVALNQLCRCFTIVRILNVFWTSMIQPNQWSKFFSLGLKIWLDWNLSSNHMSAS